jgi:hypothetical protein
MIELAPTVEERLGASAFVPGPVLELRARIDRVATYPFLEVIVSPGEVRPNMPSVSFEVFFVTIHGDFEVQVSYLEACHIGISRNLNALPAPTVDDLTTAF